MRRFRIYEVCFCLDLLITLDKSIQNNLVQSGDSANGMLPICRNRRHRRARLRILLPHVKLFRVVYHSNLGGTSWASKKRRNESTNSPEKGKIASRKIQRCPRPNL
jgi:hypothetical protein